MEKELYDLMDWAAIEAVVYSEEDHPENLLGPHKVDAGILVHTFFPDACSVKLKLKKTDKVYDMEEADEAGVFAVLLPFKRVQAYTFIVEYEDGSVIEVEDSYLYTDIIGESDISRFEAGQAYDVYSWMGAHPIAIDGFGSSAEIRWDVTYETDKKGTEDTVYGVHFAVWAPNAMRVSVVGDFNFWDGRRQQMFRVGNTGVFSIFIPGMTCDDIYKYEIKSNPQTAFLKTDPYGYACEQRPNNASIVKNIADYKWHDKKWMTARKKYDFKDKPMSVYEVHLGSWMKKDYSDIEAPTCDDEFMNYREIAPLLADYVKSMGYTHIELMPIMEHPLDESWGYQVTGYYAVTSRYGSPEDFMYFMDYMHENGIGVILDWVPAHFPKDANGLAKFDGTYLYEHYDPRKGEHPHWGTLIYNYGRPEVISFLISNVLFWIDKYHADGIRMDAVASMLYLDYGKNPGEWVPNIYGGKENLEAVELLRNLTDAVHSRKDGSIIVAEESTAWPKVTAKTEDDGLGFDLKWNMGWMNDFISYMQTDPLYRKGCHGTLLFSMVYAYSENFILVFSHDEVVHLKKSMLMKMPGDMEQKYANLRAAYGFMIAHPGKNLSFMGQEFAQEEEWNEKISLPWDEAKLPEHKQFMDYIKDLNAFYLKHPALYEDDYNEEGFKWLSHMDADHSIVTFMRTGKKSGEKLLIVCNFTPVVHEKFRIGVPFAGKYKEIFNSDSAIYGGGDNINKRQKTSKAVTWDGLDNSILVTVPPLGISVYKCIEI